MVKTMNATKNSMIIEDTKFILKYIEDNVDIKKSRNSWLLYER